MRAGGDKRGNNKDRKRRKEWLLSEFGDGETCNCVHCGKPLDINTVEADRKIPGASYARWNIQPADRHCNASRSNNLEWVGPLQLQQSDHSILATKQRNLVVLLSDQTALTGKGQIPWN